MTGSKIPSSGVGILQGQARAIVAVPWLRFFQRLSELVPRFGEATFSADTAVAVSLVPAETADTYVVAVQPPENNTFWVSSKTVDGFTLNAASTSSATVPFVIHRR